MEHCHIMIVSILELYKD